MKRSRAWPLVPRTTGASTTRLRRDKKATEDFLSWVITSDTGKKAISQDMGFTTPFKTFDDVKFDNPLTEAAVEDQKSGKTQVSWNFTMMPSEEWKNKVGQALLEYAQAPASGMPSRPPSWTVGLPNTRLRTESHRVP